MTPQLGGPRCGPKEQEKGQLTPEPWHSEHIQGRRQLMGTDGFQEHWPLHVGHTGSPPRMRS